MHKSASLLVGAALVLSSMPALAQDTSGTSSSVSSPSVSSTSSATSRPCADKKGLDRAACMLAYVRTKAQSRKQGRRQNTVAHERNAACASKKGIEKALCLRRIMKNSDTSEEKLTKNLKKNIVRRAVKMQKRDSRMYPGGSKSSRSSSSMSSTSSISSESSSDSSN